MKANRMPRPSALTSEQKREELLADLARCTVGGVYRTPEYVDAVELTRLAKAIHPKARFVETMYDDEYNPPRTYEASVRIGKHFLAYASRSYYHGNARALVRQELREALLAYKPLPRPAPGYADSCTPLPLPG